MAEVIERGQVAYVGLDALSDGMVRSAIGSILLAGLTALAGDRYNHGVGLRPVTVFVDDAAEVVNDPFIQLLNKGRDARVRPVITTHDLLLPSDTDPRDARGLEPVARSGLFALVADRLAVAWGMVELALERLAALLPWWPLAALATGTALADAAVRRCRRAAAFTAPAPLRHRLATEGLRVLGWVVLYGLLVPRPLPAVSAIAFAVTGVLLTHMLAAHT
jgi:hypothetical protein